MKLATLSFVLAAIAVSGCGPSPAMEPSTPAHARRVVACPCDDDETDDDPAVVRQKPVEYVRMDDWEPPASVKEIEARIEPRGDRPPDYVDLPRLRLHREIVPATQHRRGYDWP